MLLCPVWLEEDLLGVLGREDLSAPSRKSDFLRLVLEEVCLAEILPSQDFLCLSFYRVASLHHLSYVPSFHIKVSFCPIDATKGDDHVGSAVHNLRFRDGWCAVPSSHEMTLNEKSQIQVQKYCSSMKPWKNYG